MDSMLYGKRLDDVLQRNAVQEEWTYMSRRPGDIEDETGIHWDNLEGRA